jgi:hypothetical protein
MNRQRMACVPQVIFTLLVAGSVSHQVRCQAAVVGQCTYRAGATESSSATALSLCLYTSVPIPRLLLSRTSRQTPLPIVHAKHMIVDRVQPAVKTSSLSMTNTIQIISTHHTPSRSAEPMAPGHGRLGRQPFFLGCVLHRRPGSYTILSMTPPVLYIDCAAVDIIK